MTTPSPLFGQFGTTVAFAERTLTATLREHLAKRGIVPETWYALKLVGTRGPGIPRAELSGDLAGSRSLDSASADELLARLEAEGLIRGDERVDLTAAGETLYRSLSEYVTGGRYFQSIEIPEGARLTNAVMVVSPRITTCPSSCNAAR